MKITKMLKAKIDRKIKTTKRQQNGFEKHTGKCSTLLVIKEMQIQVEILFSAGECVTFPETQNPQTEGGAAKPVLSAGGRASLCSPFGRQFGNAYQEPQKYPRFLTPLLPR